MHGHAVIFGIVLTLAATNAAGANREPQNKATTNAEKKPSTSGVLASASALDLSVRAPAEQTSYEWNGGINLLLTLVSDGVLIAGSVMLATTTSQMDTLDDLRSLEAPGGLLLGGLSGHLLSGSIGHLCEGNIGRAIGSLFLRSGLPTLAALGGAGIGADQMTGQNHPFANTAGMVWGGVIGFGIGLVVSQLIDILVLPWEGSDPEAGS